MAKPKRRRFRLKNIKRLLCCCCPFRKKTYSLDECDDGEDDLRGRFTSTWWPTYIDPPNSLYKCLYGKDASTVSEHKQAERVEGQSGPLTLRRAVKRVASLEENEVPRAYFSLPRSLRIIADQMWENLSFQIFQTQRADHASIHSNALQRWGEVSLQITQSCVREAWSHRAICTLASNNETIVPRIGFQNILTSLKHVPACTWSKWGNNVVYSLKLSRTVVNHSLDNLHKYLQMLGKKASLVHRRQGDVYSHGKSVLVSFLHMLCQGTYYYRRRIQTFRNHCVIDYLSMFVPTHPGIFSLIFQSVIYTITASNMSFQVLKSLQYSDKCDDNWDSINDDGNADDGHKSDVDDDDEIDDRDVIKRYADNNTCANNLGYGGQFSGNADSGARTKKEVVVIYNKLDFPNAVAKTDGMRKSGSTKNRGIPRYCNCELFIQESNNQMPTRSKQNGRVRVKAALSAASDPPPNISDRASTDIV